jgi:hypothetical protein
LVLNASGVDAHLDPPLPIVESQRSVTHFDVSIAGVEKVWASKLAWVFLIGDRMEELQKGGTGPGHSAQDFRGHPLIAAPIPWP